MYEKEIFKKEHTLKLKRKDIDFTNLEQIVEVEHNQPILRKHLHTFKMRLDHYIFGNFLCPICNPKETSDYGRNIIKEAYKDDIIQENPIINGVRVDFLLKDKITCLIYFGKEYYNGKNYNKLALDIIDKFENDENYNLDILDYNDLFEEGLI